ncbi:hypothetical protein CFOL_v3_07413 [Cephalotus follicularis]|uniref:Uncharacterized protein n=1 Tax=Cephalotus follicularis TaxID=3775 RepID=A0A1Q3B7M4_CEPFO|nr:hypothetical protein CFOL_v3_07413 [Cephalotus follicularis]
MESSMGFMAVFAVSGSVILIARQVHKRLVSDFMKKLEHELGGIGMKNIQYELESKNFGRKKKVRFADDVMEPSSNNKEYRRRHLTKAANGDKSLKMEECDHVTSENLYGAQLEDTMPLNRQILYKGVLQYKSLLKGTMA